MTAKQIKTRQFKRTSKKKQHIDRQVRKVGNTTYIALGKIIPKNWIFVRITTLNKTEKELQLQIEKLYGSENNAQNTTADKGSEQNT